MQLHLPYSPRQYLRGINAGEYDGGQEGNPNEHQVGEVKMFLVLVGLLQREASEAQDHQGAHADNLCGSHAAEIALLALLTMHVHLGTIQIIGPGAGAVAIAQGGNTAATQCARLHGRTGKVSVEKEREREREKEKSNKSKITKEMRRKIGEREKLLRKLKSLNCHWVEIELISNGFD